MTPIWRGRHALFVLISQLALATATSLQIAFVNKYYSKYTSNNKNTVPTTNQGTFLYSTKPEPESEDGNNFDIDTQRQRIESLFETSSTNNNQNVNDPLINLFPDIPRENLVFPAAMGYEIDEVAEFAHFLENEIRSPPPLTSSDRKRREQEIILLQQLEYSDDPVDELCNLWYDERGVEAGASIRKANILFMEGQSGWDEAEEILYELIKEYGIHWVGPNHDLAKLKFHQGDIEYAEAIWQVVLAVKPWHIGALFGINVIYSNIINNNGVEKILDRYGVPQPLPKLGREYSRQREIRSLWVQRAVKRAEDRLNMSNSNLKDLFGEQDDHASR